MKGNTLLLIGIGVVALILGIFLLGGRRRATDANTTTPDAANMGGSSSGMTLGSFSAYQRPGESFSAYLERQRATGWGLNVNLLN